ncbi:MAG: hypothetical protein Fur0022_44770 [Anaerolineales bacterium]
MKLHKSPWLIGSIAIILIATAVSSLSWTRQTPVADPVIRIPAAPPGTNLSNTGLRADIGEPIQPVVVNLRDIPEGVYDPDNKYEQWLRGEIDPRENDFRQGELIAAELKAEAMNLPVSPNIQIATSGPGLNAPVPGISFASLDYLECCGGGGSVPPDPEMAAGPNHLIAVVNVSLEIYDKSGTSLVGPTTLDSFFGSLGGGCTDTFDPNTIYDEEADRYIIAADGGGTDYCIGVSQTGDPTGSYNLYRVPAQPVGGEFHDYPHTGVGDSYIVVGANQFGGGIPNGYEGRVWALDKAAMYSGGTMTPITASTGYDGGTPQPLHLHGFLQGTWPNLGSTHYIATDFYDGCRLDIWQWNIPAAPTIVSTIDLCTATGITGGFPVDFPQSGGSPIQANDWRMRGFEYRNGSGWIADSISCNPGGGTVDCVRWTEVDLSGTPSLEQAGVYASSGQYRTFPDLAVNQCGDMAIGYTKSSTSMFPSIWYTGRESGDPLGTLQAEAELKAGEIAYIAFDGTPYRWGDYTGMTIDPDGQTFWYLGEYSKNTGTTSGRWGTYIGSFTYPDCTGGGGNPSIELTKTVGTDPGVCATTDTITVTQGTNVTYCYTIENTGDVTFTQHTLTDSELGALLIDFPYVLVPGASAFLTQTTTILTTTVNSAIWTAEDPSVPVSVLDSDTATVIVPPPQIGVAPSEYILSQAVDNVVTYTLTINNTGGSDLNWNIFEDSTAAPLAGQGVPERLGTTPARDLPLTLPDNPNGPIVSDGGFEGGTPSAAWNEYSTNFGTPLCDAGCGFGGGTGPHSGSWWAWFGGIATYEEGSISQDVTIPLGNATLSFWLEIPVACDSAADYLEVLVDGTQVFLVDGTSALCGTVGYSLQTVNLSAYADGGLHTLEFHSEIFGTNANVTNFFVDDVAIEISGPPPVCSTANDIPWVTLAPLSGTVSSGSSEEVQVSLNTTGLTVGTTYTGTLCLESNDPWTSLVTIPISLTVESQIFGVALSADQTASADAGTTVVYTLTITNTGNSVDTFDLTATGGWTANLSQTSITLGGGEAATFTVEVTVPESATNGEEDVITVTATSQNDATATDSALLTTTALVDTFNIFLPISLRAP